MKVLVLDNYDSFTWNLVQALETGKIRGAALDVFEKEPLEVDSRLMALDNVILTSHSVA